MKVVDTAEYLSTLRTLTEGGSEVNVVISGGSMNPFLVHGRDSVCFKKPDRALKKGDMVFYQRENGQFVMHRIVGISPYGCDLLGDAQTEVEHGVRREQIFGLVTRVRRKGRWLEPGDFWWFFFEKIWIHLIPLRRVMMRLYPLLRRGRG